ncbi:MAG: hypothetical protein ABI556_14240 [Gemmatimonadales bacterium]
MRYALILSALAAASFASTALSAQKAPKWTASVQSSKDDRINIAPDSVREKSFGSFQWTQGADSTQSNVNLTFSYSGPERDLSWAVLFGPCGNASLPVVPVSTFPELNLSGSGRGQIGGTIAVALPVSGTFHVDIYKDRTGSLESLVACGNMRYARK